MSEYTITPSVMGTAIADSDIQAELNAQIAGQKLPAPTASTIYVVLFPQADQITLPPGNLSGVQFCAYHSAAGTPSNPLFYIVIPDNGSNDGTLGDGSADLFAGTACGNSSTPLNNETAVLSHEYAETINDPEIGFANAFGPPLGWYDTANGQGRDRGQVQRPADDQRPVDGAEALEQCRQRLRDD
jgi:hypothetical protein